MTEEERKLHEQNLRKCCSEWQELLALDEWHIDVHIYAKEGASFEETRSKILRNTGYAYLPFPDEAINLEDLVHFLLQIRFEMVNNEFGGSEVYFQRALHILARTLIQLKMDSDKYKEIMKEFIEMYGGKDNEREGKVLQDQMEQPVKQAGKTEAQQPAKKAPRLIN